LAKFEDSFSKNKRENFWTKKSSPIFGEQSAVKKILQNG
jgi:hypothetical protein